MASDCPRPRRQGPGEGEVQPAEGDVQPAEGDVHPAEGDVHPAAGRAREGTPSLEVRWIFPGEMETGVARWLDRFPAELELREDIYLVNPGLRGLSVKIRAGTALEVKEYRGSRGTLLVGGRVSGHMQSWQKWSFPFNPLSQGIGDPPGWQPVHKRRRTSRFSFSDGRIAAGARRLAGEPRCAVELTALRTGGRSWWSLGFEATGPAELLRGALEGTATLVFARPLPDGLRPGLDESKSYADWLPRLGPAEGEEEVDAVRQGGEVAAGQRLDPADAVADGVDVDVHPRRARRPGAVAGQERAQGRQQIGVVPGVVIGQRSEQSLGERPQHWRRDAGEQPLVGVDGNAAFSCSGRACLRLLPHDIKGFYRAHRHLQLTTGPP
jgi:hypothetical protein